MNKTLYVISDEYIKLLQEISDADGEITPEMSEALDITQDQLQGKTIVYLSVMKTNDAFVMQIDEEIKRLTALKKRSNTLTDNLKDRVLNAVLLFGEFTAGLQKFGIRKSQQIIVEDVNSLPAGYKTRKIVETADKALLKEAIKNGFEIKGVQLVTNQNLKIN